MNKISLLILVLVFCWVENFAQRSCGFYKCLQQSEVENSSFKNQKENFEQQLISWKENVQSDKIKIPDTIFIPVIFHVLWHTPVENIDSDQMISQIKILNGDFNGLNADTINTPAYFKPRRGKTRFYFQLAKQDPNGLLSNGIARKYTQNINGFSLDGSVCISAFGGDDAWDPRYYVNIWICNMESASGTFAATYFSRRQFNEGRHSM